MQVCWRLMGVSGIDFQAHKLFPANTLFAKCTSFRYKNGAFPELSQNCGRSQRLWKLFRATPKIALYKQFGKDFAFVSDYCRGGETFICMQLMFSGIYALAQLSEWISSTLRKRDVDRSELTKPLNI